MNIYITHNLGYNHFQIYHIGNRDAKQCRLSLKLQLSGQTSNFVQCMGPKCEQRLAYASGGYGLEICTMPINIVLFYCTLLQTSLSNPVTRRTASSLTVFLIGHNFETIISGEMLSTPTQCHTL